MQLHPIIGDSLRKQYGKMFKKNQQKKREFTLNFLCHFCAAENLRSLNEYNVRFFLMEVYHKLKSVLCV